MARIMANSGRAAHCGPMPWTKAQSPSASGKASSMAEMESSSEPTSIGRMPNCPASGRQCQENSADH